MTFANLATRLCGQAAVLLGWRPAEFWAATPAELATVLAAYIPTASDALGEQTLAQLLEQFPDAPMGGE